MSNSNSLQDVHDRHYDGLKLGYMRTSTVNGEVDIYVGRIISPHNTIEEKLYEGLLDSVRKVNNFPKPSNEQQVVYKLRHKPSDLFALSADSEYTEYSLTKLSTTGKIYTRKPKLPDNAFQVVYPRTFDDRLLSDNTYPDDWEVISYTLTEIKE